LAFKLLISDLELKNYLSTYRITDHGNHEEMEKAPSASLPLTLGSPAC